MQPARHSERPGRRNRERRVELRRSIFCFVVLVSCGAPPESALTDDLGRRVEIKSPPRRIVSLAPNITEMIVAAGGGEWLVGTDNYSNFPAGVERLPKVGDIQPNLELIAKLQPDAVFAISSAGHAALAQSLENIDVPLFVVRADRLDEVPRNIIRFGDILGTAEVARGAAARFNNSVSRLRQNRSSRPRVLFAVWLDPLYVAGTDTFIDDLLGIAGATNAVSVSGWPQYSRETVASAPPDIIIIASQNQSTDTLKKFLETTPPWSELAAVKSGFWYVVDQDRFARAGPRMTEAAEDVIRIIDQWERSQKRSDRRFDGSSSPAH